METTKALLLRKTLLTDTSLILTWFTAEHGLIKTVARGARRPKSRFAGMLDLFFDCEIQYAPSRKSDLHMLREVSLCNPHVALRASYDRVALGAYFVELIELVTEPGHRSPELYDLLQRAFRYLDAKPPNKTALPHFEAELARLLGIRNEAVTPAVAIGCAYHRLPAGRARLLRSLAKKSAAAGPVARNT